MPKHASFKYFKTSPEVIRLAVMLYIRFPLSLRNVEDLLHERGIDVSHETVRYWWNRFGPMFAAEIRRKRVQQLRAFSKWKWHVRPYAKAMLMRLSPGGILRSPRTSDSSLSIGVF